jgi:hypothetical protein
MNWRKNSDWWVSLPPMTIKMGISGWNFTRMFIRSSLISSIIRNYDTGTIHTVLWDQALISTRPTFNSTYSNLIGHLQVRNLDYTAREGSYYASVWYSKHDLNFHFAPFYHAIITIQHLCVPTQPARLADHTKVIYHQLIPLPDECVLCRRYVLGSFTGQQKASIRSASRPCKRPYPEMPECQEQYCSSIATHSCDVNTGPAHFGGYASTICIPFVPPTFIH